MQPYPPSPADPQEQARWEHTRLRRRMLYGAWSQDLDRRIEAQIGHVRRDAWGTPDLSSNVFRSAVSSLAVLYDRRPSLAHSDQASADELAHIVIRAGLWPLMQRVQRDTLGLREMLLRVEITAGAEGQDARLHFRPIFPDMVICEASASEPDQPYEVKELRLMCDELTGQHRWVWEIFCIEEGEDPIHQIVAASGSDAGADLSAQYLGVPGGLVGDAYPYRYYDGTPFLPIVMYHAARTGQLWDAWEASELVEGSLNVACLWSMFGHCVRQASWPQRYAVGVRVPSATIEGEERNAARESVIPDPATVLLFDPAEEGSQPMISQWQPGADPEALQTAISMYERRIAAFAGISAADVQRVAGDPRSGFAIAITREAQREAQKRYEPCFSPSDEKVLAVAAALWNRTTGAQLPEYGYRVAYETLPPSLEEMKGDREQIEWEETRGLVSPLDAYRRLHPGASADDAERAIVGNRLDSIRLDRQVEDLARAEQPVSMLETGAATTTAPDAALDGGQIDSLMKVIGEVAARRLPRESAIAILVRAFSVTPEAAAELLGPVGITFYAAEMPA